ncbi:MAG TPA: sigma-54 dependent transcriptional regulator [Polyangia bacterium]|nr:sigma-54 dependent transcriptional regulator [Polyangia bacterium]
MGRILLVDDDPSVLFALSEVLASHGHDVVTASSGAEGLARFDGEAPFDLLVTDLAMPGMNGLELLEKVRGRDTTLPVIVVTAHGSERTAVDAMKRGAYDYIAKPFDNDEIGYSIQRALETRALRTQARSKTLEKALEASGVRIVGQSPALLRAVETAKRLADKDVTVLVRGETGTGKELFGTLLHAASRRSAKPLVRFNCAAIPTELAEAQLFGYARGAFTGAAGAHAGYFVQANGGTLVLDEVGELSLPIQAKLLRVLQEREVQPLGSTHVEKIDVRLVSSTHRDLMAEVKAGRFREDLYYRIAVVELGVPPLRDRREDIPLLAREFARKYSERFGLLEVAELAPELLAQLAEAPWPGNVRQLENAIARCVALATGKVIGLSAFAVASSPQAGSETAAQNAAEGPTYREQMDVFERNLLASVLAATSGNQSEAARRLGLSRATLYDRLQRHGLLPEGAKKDSPS